MTPLVFDLDGTLINSLPTITKSVNAVLESEGLPLVPASQVAGYVGHGEQVLLDRLIADTDLDPAARPEWLARLMSAYAEASQETQLYPGAQDALEAFRSLGVPLGLCTNKPAAALDEVLRTLGWDQMFGSVVAGDSLEVRKPDPAPLLECFRELGGGIGFFVGDSPVDAQTAQRAKVPFVLHTEGIRTCPIKDIPHDAQFSEFAQLPAMYSQMARLPERS